METLGILLIIPVVLLVVIILLYNSLIAKKNAVYNALSSVDVYLKQRYDLIPNLVASVKQYMQHERELLERITELRSRLGGTLSPQERFKAEGELSNLLSRLLMVAENYPQLRASENFLHLQKTLNEIEERISAARRAYNSAVTDYNNALEMFPTNMMANMMGLKKEEWLEIPEQEREVPQVSKLFGS
ncbi:MAG: LemA family protein [Aquificaceae bacterium]|nr:LemA family protein [Aquificaceae bacterium]